VRLRFLREAGRGREPSVKIKNLYTKGPPVLSLEVFPPSKESASLSGVYRTVERLRGLSPSFVSVTYGAGGSTRRRTVEIASEVRRRWGIESLAHLTCACHSRADISETLDDVLERGVENILALRGDVPEGVPSESAFRDYRYASELVREARRRADFGVAAACYPEGHVECRRISDDLDHLREKVDSGVDFLITQLFFDNRIYFDFVDRARALGIDVPIVPGVMPLMSPRQIRRIVYLCGVSIPAEVLRLLDRWGDDAAGLRRAGTEYAVRQVRGLLDEGAPGVHLYTMNRVHQISDIVRGAGSHRFLGSNLPALTEVGV